MVEGDHQGPPKSEDPVADPLIGRTLNDRFRILEPIGSGGMGKVYKAVQSPLDRVVALKVLNPNFPAERDPNFKRRFMLEASLTSKLRHPNTVTVIDYGQTDDNIFYIAMEYLEGHTLSEVLQREKRLIWSRAFQIAQQICRALREAHNQGVVHRDLKPANVMLLDDADHDVVKVLDFGLVKPFNNEGTPVGVEVTQQGTFLGSPQYMAPEQARNITDPRSDIYSTGILLYQMMVGRPPFTGKDYLDVIFQHLKEAPAPLMNYPEAEVPGEVEAVVMKCLAKEPAHRYQSMDELLDAMRMAAAMAGSAGIFPDRTSPGFRIPVSLLGTPPPLPKVGATPSPQPMAQATPPPQTGAQPRTPTPMGTPVAGRTPTPMGTPMPGRTPTPMGTPVAGRTPGAPGPMAVPTATNTVAHPREAPPLFASSRSVEAQDASNTMALDISVVGDEAPRRKKGLLIGLAFLSFVGLGFGAVWLLARPSGDDVQTAPPVAQAQPAAAPQKTPAKEEAAVVHFHVNSEPTGAHVWLGRKDMGVTPLVFDVPAGADGTVTKELVFTLDGFYPLNVVAGGSHDVVLMQSLQRRPRAPRSTRNVATATEPAEPEIQAPAQLAVPTASPSSSATALLTSSPGGLTPAPGGKVEPAKFGTSRPDAEAVLPFGEGMTPPEVVSEGEPITYSREALAAKVEGVMIVKCLITSVGAVKNCRVIKPVPLMSQAVVSSLTSRRYAPITYRGKPVSVEYVFTIRLMLPHH